MTAVAFVLALLAAGCASDEPDEMPEPEPSPHELLDACGLAQPGAEGIFWDACPGGSEGAPYQDQDRCGFEALLAEPPNVVRTSSIGPNCGDVINGSSVDIYRWADGSMTCVIGSSSSDGLGGSSDDVTVRECSLPDTSTIEACLAAAQAGEPATMSCLAFGSWGFELGDEIEPECRP